MPNQNFIFLVLSRFKNILSCSKQITSISCEDLVEWFGKPYYLKIDIEGVDVACIKQLTPETAPKYLSTELPPLVEALTTKPYSPEWQALAEQIFDLLGYLEELGYSRFKIVPQAMFNSRVRLVEEPEGTIPREDGQKRIYAASVQGIGYGTAGLWGEDVHFHFTKIKCFQVRVDERSFLKLNHMFYQIQVHVY